MKKIIVFIVFLALLGCENEENTVLNEISLRNQCRIDDKSDASVKAKIVGEWRIDTVWRQDYVLGDQPYPNCTKGCTGRIPSYAGSFKMTFSDECGVELSYLSKIWANYSKVNAEGFNISVFDTKADSIVYGSRAVILELTDNKFRFKFRTTDTPGENTSESEYLLRR